jgi:thioester reductase-like protein
MKNYFVTGATGAIGSALVPILLRNPSTRMVLLLRAKSPAELLERTKGLFRFWGVSDADNELRNRVVALAGDVTQPQLGLSDTAYDDVTSNSTHIVHAAGNVRMNLPIDQARHSSVDSARNILTLARACSQLEKVEFVSTVGVGGRSHGTVPESWITAPREFHNTYEQAKAEAEDLIRVAAEEGLPITVHRPSMVVGDSCTGRIIHFQVFYHLCEFLSGRRTLGLAPNFGRARLDIIPADCVAGIIAWSSTSRETTGRILHSCSGPEFALPLDELRGIIRKTFSGSGISIPSAISLPAGVFSAVLGAVSLFMPSEVRRAIKTLPVFLDYLATEQTFANMETRALLASNGLNIPLPSEYLGKVLDYYLSHKKVA